MANKFAAKRYSAGEIEALQKNPNVLEVKENRLLLTLEFRQLVYEEWVRKPERSTVRRMLEIHGFDTQRLGLNFTKSVESVFKRGGRPRFSKASPETQAAWEKTVYMPTMTAEELIESGKFIWDVNRLILHPDLEAELYRRYPRQSIEDGLRAAGISPADMGYHKINWLKEKFEKASGRDTGRSQKRGRTANFDAATVKCYANHPYIQTATHEKIELKSAFYEAALPIAALPIDDVLQVFEIEPEIFSKTERFRISRTLTQWTGKSDACTEEVIPTKEILRNRMKALDSIVEKGFSQIGDITSSMNVFQRKALCIWVQKLPSDPGRKYTIRSIMLMPALTGKRMGLKKIRRIMKAYGLTSAIRKAMPTKRMGGAALRKNVKPNLLQRKFRLHRPNEVRLTDVTFLDYGEGRRAYGSALLDPVTGRLIAFLISEHNDLELALETLRRSDTHPCPQGGIYHSDQGVVYLSSTFQQEVSSHGFEQSMSKRGNCQDNAPQESFFGHFKDECNYADCKDIHELRTLVMEYADYYNHERRMWTRGRMTPVEYEEYLLSMTENEFSAYLAREEEKYRQMKEQAAKRAIERTKSLGV